MPTTFYKKTTHNAPTEYWSFGTDFNLYVQDGYVVSGTSLKGVLMQAHSLTGTQILALGASVITSSEWGDYWSNRIGVVPISFHPPA